MCLCYYSLAFHIQFSVQQGSHGPLFPGKVLTFEHGTLGTEKKYFVSLNFAKRSRTPYLLQIDKWMFDSFKLSDIIGPVLHAACALGVIVVIFIQCTNIIQFNGTGFFNRCQKFLHLINIFTAYLHCGIFHKSPTFGLVLERSLKSP